MAAESKPYYVTLTGAKNNAGDYLIKYRGRELLDRYRPDRDLVELDGWKPLTEKQLEIINKSEGLILLGGPALQKRMRPRVYRLTDSLDAIKAPIISMGIGWDSAFGDWSATHDFKLNDASLDLLRRIAEQPFLSSVRDYHTLNVMKSHGFENFIMTGCPALYSEAHAGKPAEIPSRFKKIGFSLGVSMKRSRKMGDQMREIILATRSLFPDSDFELAFHHGVSEEYLATDGASEELYREHERFIDWLDSQSIEYRDISGSAERLIQFYSGCDLHIGYRVHAHIFMSSISRASILLIEDGRGEALSSVLGGVDLKAFEGVRLNRLQYVLRRIGMTMDTMKPEKHLLADFKRMVSYELLSGVRLMQPKLSIDLHFAVMQRFLDQLP